MRYRIAMALTAAIALPLLAAPTADAAAKPSVAWSFSAGPKVDASAKVTINYSLANLPKNSTVEVRRETGASHTFKVINTLKAVNGKGSFTTTAPTQGRWKYRIYVLNPQKAALAEAGHYLYAYSNISITKFLPQGSTSGSVTVGNRLMSYKYYTADDNELDVFVTNRNNTCRSINLQLGRLPYHSYDTLTGTRTVKVVQTNAAAASVKVAPKTITTLSAKLTGAPFGVHLGEDPTYWSKFYLAGTVNCYTSNGY